MYLGETITSDSVSFLLQQKFGDGHICSGSLISPFTILTSASCLLKSDDSGDFYGASELRVVLGSQTRTVEDEKGSYMTGVTQVQTHGRFHKRTYLNNIAVLKVIYYQTLISSLWNNCQFSDNRLICQTLSGVQISLSLRCLRQEIESEMILAV